MARWQWECITLIGKPPSHEGHPRKHIQHPPTSRVCVTFCVDLEERSYFYLDVTHLGLKTSSENTLKSLTLTGSCNESIKNDFSCLAPCLHKHKGRLSTARLNDWMFSFCELWGRESAAWLWETHSPQPVLYSVSLSRHYPFCMMELSSTDSIEPILWSAISIFQGHKTIQDRVLMPWALFYTWFVPPSYHPSAISIFFWFLNGKSKAPAIPKYSWKVKN